MSTQVQTQLLQLPVAIENLVHLYQQLLPFSETQLAHVYASNVSYEDPITKLSGREALRLHFVNLLSRVDEIAFQFDEVHCFDDPNKHHALLCWKAEFCHSGLNQGEMISVEGCTQVHYQEKITHQKHYFDLGNLVYENIPWMGWGIKQLKNRLTA